MANFMSIKTNKVNLVVNAIGIAANAYFLYTTGKKKHALGIGLGLASLALEQFRRGLAIGYATPVQAVDIAEMAVAADLTYDEAKKGYEASGYTVAPAHADQVKAALTSARVALAEMQTAGESPAAIKEQAAYVTALFEAYDSARQAQRDARWAEITQ